MLHCFVDQRVNLATDAKRLPCGLSQRPSFLGVVALTQFKHASQSFVDILHARTCVWILAFSSTILKVAPGPLHQGVMKKCLKYAHEKWTVGPQYRQRHLRYSVSQTSFTPAVVPYLTRSTIRALNTKNSKCIRQIWGETKWNFLCHCQCCALRFARHS